MEVGEVLENEPSCAGVGIKPSVLVGCFCFFSNFLIASNTLILVSFVASPKGVADGEPGGGVRGGGKGRGAGGVGVNAVATGGTDAVVGPSPDVPALFEVVVSPEGMLCMEGCRSIGENKRCTCNGFAVEVRSKARLARDTSDSCFSWAVGT